MRLKKRGFVKIELKNKILNLGQLVLSRVKRDVSRDLYTLFHLHKLIRS
jgi:hypothetical protein